MKLLKNIFVFDALAMLACCAMIWTGTGVVKTAAAEIVTFPHMVEPGDSLIVAEMPESPTEKRVVASKVLTPNIPDTLPYLTFEPDMLQAMYEQANYLRRKDVKDKGASGIHRPEMLRTVELLQRINLLDPSVLVSTFDFYEVNTDLKHDRVRMTGYYTPVIKASRVQTAEYAVPMLRRPETVPSPAAIKAGSLAGQNLELAWVRSEKELKNAQLQGNCLVEFPDGKREHFGFGGSVKGKGGVYVFFTKVDDQVLGAGTFPLTACYSVAVDLRYIPLGATLLAELPDLDAAGNLKGYTYRILFAQDRGGAILTTKRMDLYCGIGQKGLQEARKINGLGRLWVMLPKE
ncbi:MAG: MltA domain-containing protein [Saprospiraceae bacterium]|nr:MltA domain-containing protein [Saprospiraceae bacterium]